MRENHPVTQQERIFDNDATLMSTTDLRVILITLMMPLLRCLVFAQ
jgi:hypothetical protein